MIRSPMLRHFSGILFLLLWLEAPAEAARVRAEALHILQNLRRLCQLGRASECLGHPRFTAAILYYNLRFVSGEKFE